MNLAGYLLTKTDMTMKQSAGILLYRLTTPPAKAPGPYHPAPTRGAAAPHNYAPTTRPLVPEVFLVHPGGPFWKNKDAGAWTIPKGEFTADEPPLDAAIREFREETGIHLTGHFIPLTPIRQKGGKRVYAWAIAGDLDPADLVSNTFELQWPPGSGRMKTFPEVDRGAWYPPDAARAIINPAQIAFLDELAALLATE